MAAILSLLTTFQAGFSAYNLYLFSIAIPKLQKYEETSEKAAKYSNMAENELYKTRVTQASGVGSVLASFLTSITLLFSAPHSGTTKLILALVNVAVLLVAKDHVGGHWRRKFKLPLPKTGDYNDAIGATQEVLGNFIWMVGGWVVLGALGLVL